MPKGWDAISSHYHVPILEAGKNITVRFQIIPPEATGDISVQVVIDFEAAVLETGETIQGQVPILIKGLINRLPFLLLVVIGLSSVVSSLFLFNYWLGCKELERKKRELERRVYNKEQRDFKRLYNSLEQELGGKIMMEPDVLNLMKCPFCGAHFNYEPNPFRKRVKCPICEDTFTYLRL
jgi:hypothetical protein